MRETKNLEYKEKVTNTFLKTVSAYANYGTGQIKFGIDDNGKIIGNSNPEQVCLDIENKINDLITPHPDFSLSIDDQTNVITLTVNQGVNTPYFYKSKAYKRNDSSSIAVNTTELSRLILKSKNLTFDALISNNQKLTFKILEHALQNKLGIKKLTSDILITLDLKNKNEGYTNAAELLADKNNFRGIDIVRFGNSIDIISDREIEDKTSILKQYNQAIKKYRQYYQHEEIKGSTRNTVEQIPEEAFRESIANALVHRTWDINSQIKVAMFNDRIEVTSPGGLPEGISEQEYLAGSLSVLRNPIIASVFFRLGLIEQFGTGVRRIIAAYTNSIVKPRFNIEENSIKITLPIIQISHDNMSLDEQKIYEALQDGPKSNSEIAVITKFGRTKALSLIKKLIEKGYLEKIGNGRATRYQKL